MYIIS